jgi:NitT/TauT family transport system ATP-binding protein
VADFASIAQVSMSRLVGLIEAVDEIGGAADVATISQEVDMDVDHLGPVLTAAELLGLVNVADGDVKLTDRSRQLLSANIRQRRALLRNIVDEVPGFHTVLRMARQAGRPLTREEALDAFAAEVGRHQAEGLFQALVYWGRYLGVVRYDSASEQLTLRETAK